MEPSEELCRFTRPGRKRPGLARAMWDLPLLGNLPSHLQNGYEATPNRVVTASKLTVPDVAVDILTNGVAALELTTTTDTDQPVNLAVELNDASGKGFTTESFIAHLQDPDIFKLESHFKWMLELASPDGRLDAQRIATLKLKMLAWVAESDQHLSVFQTVAQKLLLATYTGFLDGHNDEVGQYFAEAQQTIIKARDEPDANDIPSVEQIRVYRYIRLCDELLISQFSLLLNNNGSDVTIENIRATVAEYDIGNQQVFGDNASKATLFGMKAHLANQLGDTSQTIEYFRKAAELNPVCYDWQHHLYTALRRRRREADFGCAPSKDERNVCQLGNQLRPDYWVSLVALANLYLETNKARRQKPSEDERRSNQDKAINALVKACELAPTNVSVNIKLAEAYSEMDLSPKDMNSCKRLFEYCEKTWPTNSEVFHKIGKFYLKKDDSVLLAEKYFATALEADPSNFPCLHDYLRLKFSYLSGQDSIELVDTFIPSYKYKKTFLGKLLAIKGYLQWNSNAKMDAVQSWIIGFEALTGPDKGMLDNFYQRTLSGFNGSFFAGNNVVDFNEVREMLKEFNPSQLSDVVPDVQTRIDGFMEFLDAKQANNSWRTKNRYRNVSTSSHVGIQAVDWDWRNGNDNMNRENPHRRDQNWSNDQRRRNAADTDGGGDSSWRRRTATDPTSQPAPFMDYQSRNNRFGSTSRYTNGESGAEKSIAAEDMNWRQKDQSLRNLEAVSRDVVFKDEFNFQVTAHYKVDQSFVDVGNDDRDRRDYSNSRNGIPLDNRGRWEKADPDEEPHKSGRNNRATRSKGSTPKREYSHNGNWR